MLGSVVEGEGLRVLRAHFHRLRPGGLVNGVAGNRPGFLDHDSTHHAGNSDFSVGIGGIQAIAGQVAVGGVHIAAASIGQLKFHTGQRLLGDGIQLADYQPTSSLVPKGQRLRFAFLNGDTLGLAVQDKSIHRLGFFSGDGLSWFQSVLKN